MLFFQRILKEPAASGPAAVRKERRSDQRLVVGPEFPLKAVLSFDRRGGSVAPMAAPLGWDWPGRVLNCSEVGARIRLGPGSLAARGDFCELRLDLEGFKLAVPCRITNTRVERDGIHFGLRHDIEGAAVAAAYRQLLEVVALGATLRLQAKTAQPDDSGYLVEQYAGGWQSRLKIWRESSGRKVTAFEFLLKDCLVRAARGRPAEFLTDAVKARPAPPAQAAEIRRLFGWVVPNLAPAVPEDVREFLKQYAG